jgi:hypothetical protein
MWDISAPSACMTAGGLNAALSVTGGCDSPATPAGSNEPGLSDASISPQPAFGLQLAKKACNMNSKTLWWIIGILALLLIVLGYVHFSVG